MRGVVQSSAVLGLLLAACAPSSSAGPAPDGAPEITTATLEDATVGASYSARLEAEGGTPPYRWTLQQDDAGLGWLSLDAETGTLGGEPVAPVSPAAALTVQVADAQARTASRELRLAVVGCEPGREAWCYEDRDRDGFPSASAVATRFPCVRACPAGWTARSSPRDCVDTDEDAYPGQPIFFASPTAEGGFDYDCDGREEKMITVRLPVGCLGATPPCPNTVWVGSSVPACGQAGVQETCIAAATQCAGSLRHGSVQSCK